MKNCTVINTINEDTIIYTKPKAFEWAKNTPDDLWRFTKNSFSKKNLLITSSLTVLTLAILPADEYLLHQTNSFSRDIHLSSENIQLKEANFSIGKSGHSLLLPVFVPGNLNTGFYFLGDGLTHFTILGAYWIYGKLARNYRAIQTSSQLLECLLATGIVTQTMKHISGRESPFVSSKPGGRWDVFPNQKNYSNNVPHYDAFPSGHLATLMGTVTVIADNYPEYRFIRPVGYSLCALLGFGMVNNGVHWVSDYPIGLAIGYSMGKIIAKKGCPENTRDIKTGINKLKPDLIFPVMGNNINELTCLWTF